MTLSPLANFVALLEHHNDLARITVPVDPVLEIAAITGRVCKEPEGGRALLFEQPLRSNFRVATNLFGSRQRVCRALGASELNELAGRLNSLLDLIPETDYSSLDRQISACAEFSRFTPQSPSMPDSALIEMDQPDLTVFPFLHSWPEDGSAGGYPRYITLPQVVTASPDGGNPNCGLYRVQVRGARELAIQWKSGSGAARRAREFAERGSAMPVAVVLGGEPAMLFSAMFPLPGDLDEIAFAGFLRGGPLAVEDCRSVPLRVPAGAEIIIEGYIPPHESVVEGPFGNHTGFYAPAAAAPLMRVTSIRHRPGAIIPATVVGPPPMEDCWMALAWERLLLAFLRKLVPQIKELHFPVEWVFHQSAIISLDNPCPGMVSEVSAQLWGLPWFAASRILIFMNADHASGNGFVPLWSCINLVESTDDIIHDTTSRRIAIDATGCRTQRRAVGMSEEMARRVVQRWGEYGLA